MTTLLDRLEAKSYVGRVSHPQDRRSLLVRLTPSGEQALVWAFDHYHRTMAAVLAAAPGRDVGAVVDFLTSADRVLDETGDGVSTAASP